MEHTHSHTQTQKVVNRLAKIEGHVRSIKEMVQNGRDCPEVLIQVAAVQSALQQVGRVILEDHLEHCLIEAVQENSHKEPIEKFKDALAKFIR
ncbi:metal-sensing transcriptional repressor [Candidatus Poribacteria bacterium]|nr:metal-sensing transcriptional repressor [Candidatus Poribacteria bacterium]